MFKKALFFVSITVGLLLFCASCSRRTPTKDEKAEAARQEKEEYRLKVLEMASRHGADLQWVTFWERGGLYTIELQQALLEPPGRTRLLLAEVVDVLKRDDAYFLTAHQSWPNIYFQLQCDAEHAQYVLSTSANEPPRYADYAIVMQPKSVHKPVAQLAGEVEVDSAYLVHEVSDIVVVKGTCIDILSLDDSFLSAGDLLAPHSEETK